jgi:vacuolar-type H+-ATPase subunit F/Vma7
MMHGIPYVATFIVLWNMIVDSNFFMSLGILWLKDAKVTHDWNNNISTIQKNETIRIIIITKHLRDNIKKP